MANRILKAPTSGPEVPVKEVKRAKKRHDPHWRGSKPPNFGGPDPPLSILDTKIQKKQNRRN